MGNRSSRHDTKLIDFEEVRAPRGAAAADRRSRGKARPVIIMSMMAPEAARPESGEAPGGSAPALGWERALMRRARRSAAVISSSRSTLDCAIAGFKRAVRELGIEGVRIPADLPDQMKRSLTYRLPNETWHAIRGLDRRSQGTIMFEMVSSVHDGWARDNARSLFGEGGGCEYLFLPVELAGKASFNDAAASIMRYLPSLGLDLSMDRPSQYDMLYAHHTMGDVLKSPSFAALADAYLVARTTFADLNEINGPDDLARYIAAYGKYNRLLGEAASSRLRDHGFAYEVAMQVSRSDPARIVARW